LALFLELTGGSPTRFIEHKRYLQACELLMTTPQSVAQIAAALHYSDAFQFSRKFKENAGVTPRQFRQAGYAPQKRAAPVLKDERDRKE